MLQGEQGFLGLLWFGKGGLQKADRNKNKGLYISGGRDSAGRKPSDRPQWKPQVHVSQEKRARHRSPVTRVRGGQVSKNVIQKP